MIVGVPKEIKADENRVAITPAGVAALTAHGHKVLVERGAGRGSSIPDALYREVGARIVGTRDVWRRADMVLKVKEPVSSKMPAARKVASSGSTAIPLSRSNPTISVVLAPTGR